MEDNYDKLDDFFRRSMQDHTPDDSWNVPSNSLFENSISQIKIERPKWYRNKALFLLPFLFIFVSGTYLIIVNLNPSSPQTALINENINDNLEQLKAENNALKHQIASLTESNSKLQEDVIELSNSTTKNNVQLKSLISNQIATYPSKDIASLKSGTNSDLTKDIKQRVVSNNKTTGYVHSHLKVTPVLHDDKSNAINSTENSIHYPALLSVLPKINYTNNLSSNKTLLFPLSKIELAESSNHKRNYFVGVSLGVNSSWLTMNKIPKGDMEQVTDYEKSHSCYGAMVNFGYKVNTRWRLVADVSYNRYVSKSKSKYDFFYNEENVYTDQNGLEMYKANLPMMNPLGDYDANLSFRVNNTMQQNELIKEKTQTRQMLDAVALNLGADYSLLKYSKFRFIIGAGFGVTAKVNLKNEFDISIYIDDKLKHNTLEVTNDMKGVNPLVLNGYLKAGLDYMINDHLSIGIETVGLKSFTSLRNSWPNGGPKTYLNAFNSTVGMKYYW